MHRSSHLVKAEQVQADLELLAKGIHNAIEGETARRKDLAFVEGLGKFPSAQPSAQAIELVKIASNLFKGISDLHTIDSLRLIVSRYVSMLENVRFEYFRVTDTASLNSTQ